MVLKKMKDPDPKSNGYGTSGTGTLMWRKRLDYRGVPLTAKYTYEHRKSTKTTYKNYVRRPRFKSGPMRKPKQKKRTINESLVSLTGRGVGMRPN
jgi:hypothetical protein